MQFHPHGDASIGDALVQMGQKDQMCIRDRRYTLLVASLAAPIWVEIIEDEGIVCPISGTKNWTDVRQFNLMFPTPVSYTHLPISSKNMVP